MCRAMPSKTSAVSLSACESTGVNFTCVLFCRASFDTCATYPGRRLNVMAGRPDISRSRLTFSSHCSPATKRRSSLASSRISRSCSTASAKRSRAIFRNSLRSDFEYIEKQGVQKPMDATQKQKKAQRDQERRRRERERRALAQAGGTGGGGTA